MLLGCHLSIGKGFSKTLDEAESLGTNAIQIFSHNASSWRMKEITGEIATSFQQRFARSSVEFIVIHTMYLLNLASPDDALYDRSILSLEEEIRRAGILGIDQIVTHIGAHKGSGIEAGIAHIITAFDHVLASDVAREYPSVRVLLEDTAGGGTTMGTKFSELGAIIDGLDDPSRVGICLDTCHAFAAGYELPTPAGLQETLDEFDREIGLDHLELIHLNDSKFPLGSRHDRHAHIGFGEIGIAGISQMVNHPSLRDLPFILETPKEINGKDGADAVNLIQVRSLRKEKED
ncbi:MAG: deoxyribonuclease IV [Candidatus Bipolaricaulota bacterium]|nr:deoxyribonuclease IV [Candidatus Bipolaricaulota bacterium]